MKTAIISERTAESRTADSRTAIERQIAATDNAIDQLVYELYRLTEAEVEAAEKVRG
jgi:hypothetical protein